MPQLFIAPRGLITVLLFYAIPAEAQIATFEPGILLFVIIGTSLIMTWAMIKDKKKTESLLDLADEEKKNLEMKPETAVEGLDATPLENPSENLEPEDPEI